MDETTIEPTAVEHESAGETPPEATPIDPALALAREALIAAHPAAVPELIGGATVDELRASVEVARQAYDRIAAEVRSRLGREAVSPAAVTRSQALDLAALSPSAKIALGLSRRDASA